MTRTIGRRVMLALMLSLSLGLASLPVYHYVSTTAASTRVSDAIQPNSSDFLSEIA